MALKFANNARSTLASSITSATTTLTVAGGTGVRFPATSPGDYFIVTVYNALGAHEIMRCTTRINDTLTVVRGQEGTTAIDFDAGAFIANLPTAAQLASFFNLDNDGSGSGLDADKVDGFHATQSASPNSVAVRDGNGKLAGDILGNAATATNAVTSQNVSGGTASVTSLTVSGASNLQATSATSLSVTGSSSLQNVSATSVTATTVTAGGGTLAQATETVRGTLEVASIAEAAAGTNNSVAITPATLRVGLAAPGSAPIFACRAWANFDGTTGNVRASGNLLVSRNDRGGYQCTFSTPMPDANYAVLCLGSDNSPTTTFPPNSSIGAPHSLTTTGFGIRMLLNSDDLFNSHTDKILSFVAVFR